MKHNSVRLKFDCEMVISMHLLSFFLSLFYHFPAFLRVQKRRSNGDHHWVALGPGKTIPHLPFIEEVSPLYLQQRFSLNEASSLNRRNMFGIGGFFFSEKTSFHVVAGCRSHLEMELKRSPI